MTDLEQSLERVEHDLWLWGDAEKHHPLSPERAEQMVGWRQKRERLLIELAAERAEIERVMKQYSISELPAKSVDAPENEVVFMPRTTEDAWRDERTYGFRHGCQPVKRRDYR